jgi:hypothetical protein
MARADRRLVVGAGKCGLQCPCAVSFEQAGERSRSGPAAGDGEITGCGRDEGECVSASGNSERGSETVRCAVEVGSVTAGPVAV